VATQIEKNARQSQEGENRVFTLRENTHSRAKITPTKVGGNVCHQKDAELAAPQYTRFEEAL